VSVVKPRPSGLVEPTIGTEDEAKRHERNDDFAECADEKGARPLPPHLVDVGVQAHASERQQKGPTRKVAEAGELASPAGCRKRHQGVPKPRIGAWPLMWRPAQA
jgi:hypothetical protein